MLVVQSKMLKWENVSVCIFLNPRKQDHRSFSKRFPLKWVRLYQKHLILSLSFSLSLSNYGRLEEKRLLPEVAKRRREEEPDL